MTEIKVPTIDIEKAVTEFNNTVKEAAYVAVGLGVLGFQRAQVQRVELAKQLEAQLAGLNSLSANLGTQVETLLSTVREQLAEARTQVNKVSADLPDPEVVRGQLADLAKSVEEAVAPVRQQFDEQLDRLEEVLPEAARNLVHTIRSAAVTQEQALRTAVGLS